MANDPTVQRIEEYLSTLRNSCAGVPEEDREEFVHEIHSHLLERIELSGPAAGESLDSILEATGRPWELAAQLKAQCVLRRTSHSVAPWVLIAGMFRLATTGIAGFLALLLAAAGYGCAIASALTIVLKPVFPARVGLWLSTGHTLTLGFWDGNLAAAQTYGISFRSPLLFVLGTFGPDGPVRELAGPWVVLIAAIAGVAFLAASVAFSRWAIARLGVRRHQTFRSRASVHPHCLA